jgi:hypothetical protein
MILGNSLPILFDVAIPSSHWIPIFIPVGISHRSTMMSLIICIQAAAPTEDFSYVDFGFGGKTGHMFCLLICHLSYHL